MKNLKLRSWILPATLAMTILATVGYAAVRASHGALADHQTAQDLEQILLANLEEIAAFTGQPVPAGTAPTLQEGMPCPATALQDLVPPVGPAARPLAESLSLRWIVAVEPVVKVRNNVNGNLLTIRDLGTGYWIEVVHQVPPAGLLQDYVRPIAPAHAVIELTDFTGGSTLFPMTDIGGGGFGYRFVRYFPKSIWGGIWVHAEWRYFEAGTNPFDPAQAYYERFSDFIIHP